jgi:hypothetical protein
MKKQINILIFTALIISTLTACSREDLDESAKLGSNNKQTEGEQYNIQGENNQKQDEDDETTKELDAINNQQQSPANPVESVSPREVVNNWYGVYTDGNITVKIENVNTDTPYVRIEEEIKTAVDFVFEDNVAHGTLYINNMMMFGENGGGTTNTPETGYTFTLTRSGSTLKYYRKVTLVYLDGRPDVSFSVSATLQKQVKGSD